MSHEKQADSVGKRVYTYVGDDGVVFYSFHRYSTMVVPPLRLYMRSRLGEHLLNFLVKMRSRGGELMGEPEDPGV